MMMRDKRDNMIVGKIDSNAKTNKTWVDTNLGLDEQSILQNYSMRSQTWEISTKNPMPFAHRPLRLNDLWMVQSAWKDKQGSSTRTTYVYFFILHNIWHHRNEILFENSKPDLNPMRIIYRGKAMLSNNYLAWNAVESADANNQSNGRNPKFQIQLPQQFIQIMIGW